MTTLESGGRAAHAAGLADGAAVAQARRTRALLSLGLVFADCAMAAMVLLSVHGVPRAVYGLAFCLVVPGWSIVGLLRLRNGPLEAGLTMAAGLSAIMVVAQLAMTLHLWHLAAIQLVVCALCLPSLSYQALRRDHGTAP